MHNFDGCVGNVLAADLVIKSVSKISFEGFNLYKSHAGMSSAPE